MLPWQLAITRGSQWSGHAHDRDLAPDHLIMPGRERWSCHGNGDLAPEHLGESADLVMATSDHARIAMIRPRPCSRSSREYKYHDRSVDQGEIESVSRSVSLWISRGCRSVSLSTCEFVDRYSRNWVSFEFVGRQSVVCDQFWVCRAVSL